MIGMFSIEYLVFGIHEEKLLGYIQLFNLGGDTQPCPPPGGGCLFV